MGSITTANSGCNPRELGSRLARIRGLTATYGLVPQKAHGEMLAASAWLAIEFAARP
ncbi:hypothetical protein [uncultured Paludibaculum sp.]|uniref:hypothetical protein n=1 Tax=uncultured Paludibaculum sp. TaxID=1765020 RepID=UPI002AAC2DC5|nr:hypothetical protein [uncultured Paludibaculum sp.]